MVYRPQCAGTTFRIRKKPGKIETKLKGATGIEPVTSRSVVKCSVAVSVTKAFYMIGLLALCKTPKPGGPVDCSLSGP